MNKKSNSHFYLPVNCQIFQLISSRKQIIKDSVFSYFSQKIYLLLADSNPLLNAT